MQKPQPREVSAFDNQLCCLPALQLYLFHIFNSINLLPFLVYVLTKIKNFVGKHEYSEGTFTYFHLLFTKDRNKNQGKP